MLLRALDVLLWHQIVRHTVAAHSSRVAAHSNRDRRKKHEQVPTPNGKIYSCA